LVSGRSSRRCLKVLRPQWCASPRANSPPILKTKRLNHTYSASRSVAVRHGCGGVVAPDVGHDPFIANSHLCSYPKLLTCAHQTKSLHYNAGSLRTKRELLWKEKKNYLS